VPPSILLTPFGSLGDLHPYLALARGLKDAGFRVAVGSVEAYRSRVEGLGLEFRPIGPHLDPEDPRLVRLAVDVKRGTENIFRTLIMPGLRRHWDDTLREAAGFDLLVGHPIALCTPLAAEKLGRPWISVALAPLSYLSAHEPAALAGHPFLSWLMRGPVWVRRAVLAAGRVQTAGWLRPVADLRRELGLPPGGHPLFEGQHSPHLALGLFSKLVGTPKPDWPARVAVTGYCFFDGPGPLPPALARFLDAGPPPIVFTMGSSAVLDAGAFFDESAAAARALGRRALLVGREEAPEADGVLRTAYAPYSLVFPRAAAVVSTAGSGTLSQGLRAGKPLVVVPYGNDQPDNAARVRRLGVSRTIPRTRYERRSAAAALRELLDDPDVAVRAADCARVIAAEDGVRSAVNAVMRSVR
jgi:UDP:flavonoid glycosyltransferase YjiC (YdhE family)